ncbi:MAG: FAD-binding oxidoreductase [Mariprofundaceae bacterium]|nr:FAD-binding oxidoreductase [Mariprofundaceae bacterium]
MQVSSLPKDVVAEDSLPDIPRQQSNPTRWQGEQWGDFVQALQDVGIKIREKKFETGVYITDAGGLAHGLPHGVVIAKSAEQIAHLMQLAQKFEVPVTTRGGGLTTEGESVAFGGVLLDMTGMSRVLEVDKNALTVRTQAGIFWHHLAEHLRRDGLDYLSAPLNLSSSVGGTLGVGGIDVNSSKHGCSADQALSLQVVTPTGEIVECSDEEHGELFERVILGYGQFGIITEATLKIRPYTPLRMHYFYYSSLKPCVEDLLMLDQSQSCDYTGMLTMMDSAITLLVAFDSEERESTFMAYYQERLSGYGELGFALRLAAHFSWRPWKWKEALFLLQRKRELFPDLEPNHHMQHGKMYDRTAVFSKAVWKHWGDRHMVIPDLATNADKIVDAVERGNAVCRKYFPYYTLYCVGIRLREEHQSHYELSSIPSDAKGFAYGCEFEPMYHGQTYSRDTLQSFKNEIYDVGVELETSYYRFGGMMKAYIRRALGDDVVEKHLKLKQDADPAMILNRDVIF